MFISTTRSPEKSQQISPVVLNVNKKILNRQSIFRKFEPNQNHREQNCKNTEKVAHKLTEQQIKTSSIYCRLQQRMRALVRNTKLHNQSYENMVSTLNVKIKNQKDNVHQTKLSIWELKNQLLDLEQELQNEERLWDDHQMLHGNQEDYQQQYNDEYQQQQDSQQQMLTNQQQDEPEFSRPTCSINQFLAGQSQAQFSSNFIFTSKSANNQQVPHSLQQIIKQQSDQYIQSRLEK